MIVSVLLGKSQPQAALASAAQQVNAGPGQRLGIVT